MVARATRLHADRSVRATRFFHLPESGFKFLRASLRSRAHFRASLGSSFADANADASSLPVQTFSLAGTIRAVAVTLILFFIQSDFVIFGDRESIPHSK